MSKQIDTLIDDIYNIVDKGVDKLDDSHVEAFKEDLGGIVQERLKEYGKVRDGYLRLSALGTHCDRKLWFTVNHAELAEPLHPSTKLKFLIGDMWEAVLLFLARVAGHKVEGQQDAITVAGVKGHRDAVIDGVLVDVKSASSRSFDKFRGGLSPASDDFGYLRQLASYFWGSSDDPKVQDHTRAAFLVGDKTLGKLHLDIHEIEGSKEEFEAFVESKKDMVNSPKMPPRGYDDVPDGKSGNLKLPTPCTYCAFKHNCWPGLRTFVYSNGPRYLTKVVRTPDVPEA